MQYPSPRRSVVFAFSLDKFQDLRRNGCGERKALEKFFLDQVQNKGGKPIEIVGKFSKFRYCFKCLLILPVVFLLIIHTSYGVT